MATPETAPKAEDPKANIPTLHHLQNSQSQRIIWLLEELGIEYNLKLYPRIDDRASPELKKIHPMGKSPILVTAAGTPLIESAAIATYLLQTYDPSGKFACSEPLREELLTSFASSTMTAIITTQTLVEVLPKRSPWPISTLMSKVRAMVWKDYSAEEFKRTMTYLEGELGDREWFNGEMLGKSDVMLFWPLDTAAQRGWVDFEKEYKALGRWRRRILEREAWKRGLEKGNGYNLRAW